MSVKYACSHLDLPRSPLPPSYPSSSSSSFHPLDSLYFCEECDAVRCDLCVAVEVASYYCPNCLFDVPSANVRADKNRCARSCFSCPQCESSLSVQATDPPEPSSSTAPPPVPGPPYVLVCSGCKWSSREVGWTFDKPTGIAMQLQKSHTQTEIAQSEFDALKDHLESYLTLNVPTPSPVRSARAPSRHISYLTQMAAKALHRDVSGMAAHSARARTKSGPKANEHGEKIGWDEMDEYNVKGSWREKGLQDGLQDVEVMRGLEDSGDGGVAALQRRWAKSWDHDRMAKSTVPERIALQTKLTKRCPHPNCRHLLIQPDTKTVRMKIKMVAINYLPLVELGRRRRRVPSSHMDVDVDSDFASTEDMERRRRERRRTRGPQGKEEDESMDRPLQAGETYSFQLALTNPLFDPIQIRLTQTHSPRSAPPAKCTIVIPTPHFTINALKDAWAYDEEDEEDALVGGSEAGFSEEGTTTTGTGTATGTLGRKSKLSVLGGGSGSGSGGKKRETGVDKRGNISKVGLEVQVAPEAEGKVEFDLEVRYTYRAEDAGTPTGTGAGAGAGAGTEAGAKEEYKTFTFYVRVLVGYVE